MRDENREAAISEVITAIDRHNERKVRYIDDCNRITILKELRMTETLIFLKIVLDQIKMEKEIVGA